MSNSIYSNLPEFPLTVHFEDGSMEQYESIRDLECNLEGFDSNCDTECQVLDAKGRPVVLVLKLLRVKELRLFN